MALSKKRDWMKASEAADYLHISYITLKKYADKGKINYELTPGGQRIYLISELNRIKGINNDNNDTDAEKHIAFYLRDSQGKQSHIDHQREKLMKYAGREPDYVYSDKASGLNEKRKGLKRLLRDAKKGKISTVYITAKDRLTRFGYEYLSELLSEYGCDIVVMDDEYTKSMHEELIQDFLSLLASFSGKYYKLRSLEHERMLLKLTEERLKQESESE